MILTPHAITGVALASLVPNKPFVGFAAGFISHFLLDAVPHWDYSLASSKIDENNPMNNDMIIGKKFFKDFLKISLDGLTGLLIGYLFFGFYLDTPLLAVLFGAAGGVMPDALQFVYMKWRHEPLVSLQKLHLMVHSKKSLKEENIIGYKQAS